jgi:GntR family transcriptional repressor for pyruvate dehydrogenase complex
VTTTSKGKTIRRRRPRESATGAVVVEHVRRLIEDGQLGRGDRLPPERELALQVGVSRPSLRYGLRALQAMGVIRARQGSGTFVADGPPRLSEGPLRFLAALHGIGRDEMFQARRVLEVGAAGLAAEHADQEQMTRMAEEVASMFATMDNPQQFLVHDVQFHRAVAAASGNRILATLIDTGAELVYEVRRTTVERARDLRESAEMHRRIYKAIKTTDPDRARREMAEHLDLARQAQAREEAAERQRGSRAPAPTADAGSAAAAPVPAPRRPRG